jgi:hypothetical protein
MITFIPMWCITYGRKSGTLGVYFSEKGRPPAPTGELGLPKREKTMSENESESQDCVDRRTKRALDECMTVLPNHGRADGAPGLFVVIGENGRGEYLVDTRTESCECKDAEYRDPEGGCKHLRRCRIATGETPVPADALGEVTVDETFGAQVDASPKFATADGGVIDGDTGEFLEDDTEDDRDPDSESEDVWSDPRPEMDKHGVPTGAHVVECTECGIETITTLTDHASHREGCSYSHSM